MRRVCFVLSLVLAISALFTGSVQADSIAVLNPSFESPTETVAGTSNDIPTSWVEKNTSWWCGVALIPGWSAMVSPPDATTQCFWANGGNGSDQFEGITQVLGATLAANTTYTLTVDVGQRSDTAFGGQSYGLGYGSTPGTNLLTAATMSNATPGSGAWATSTWTWTTGASPAGLGQALRVELCATGLGGTQSLFDDVRLSATPEPGTLALLAVGLLSLLAYAWRRRR